MTIPHLVQHDVLDDEIREVEHPEQPIRAQPKPDDPALEDDASANSHDQGNVDVPNCVGSCVRDERKGPLQSPDLKGIASLILSGRVKKCVVMVGAGISVAAGVHLKSLQHGGPFMYTCCSLHV